MYDPILLTQEFQLIASIAKPNSAIAPQSPANLTIKYQNSKVRSLTLFSFYYGCNFKLEQGVVSSAAACTITVTGYNASSTKPAASQIFNFVPVEAIDVMDPPTFGVFKPTFQGLESVVFSFKPVGILPVNIVIDDLVGAIEI